MHPTLIGLVILLALIYLFLKVLESFLTTCIDISQTPWGWSFLFATIGGIAALVGWLTANVEMTLYSLGIALFLPVCIGFQRLVGFYTKEATRAKKAQERALYHRQFFGHS